MVIVMNEINLTPKNLAIIGIIDDFYDLYCEIKDIYEMHRKIYVRENVKNYPLLSKIWDDLCIRDVRKAFEPYLQKYLYLYGSGYENIYANAYAFNDFSFIDSDKRTIKFNNETSFILSYKSFPDFLIEFQMVITVLDYRKSIALKPSNTMGDSWERINRKFLEAAKEKEKEFQNSIVDNIPYTNDTLYVFDKLSNISCCKQDHPIISARYIATVAKTARKISLPVHYCNYCKKFFIGSITLRIFEKSFGKLVVEKKDISELKKNFESFSAESKLHSLGYNVIKGNMSNTEREQLLIYLIEHDKISYVELCTTIEQNINIFKNSYIHRFAIEKWNTDLKAIGNYILNHPEKSNQ